MNNTTVSTQPDALSTPILFIVFNRPDTTEQVFEAIRKAKPSRLYIAADGFRPNKTNEEKLCLDTRAITEKINWECEIKTLFQEKNLGCKHGVSTAINWFFDHEEQGIILEDDVIPHPIFFKYCETMLERYKDNQAIMMITGFNPLGSEVKSNDYFFSNIPNIWGWATWKSRWQYFDVSIQEWPSLDTKNHMKQFMPKKLINSYETAFERVKSGNLDTWDYQWTFAIFKNKGLTIKSYANLITNIGIVGTHSTHEDQNHCINYGNMSGIMLDNNQIVPNKHEDDHLCKSLKEQQNLKQKIIDILISLRLYNISRKIYQKIYSAA